MYLYIGLLVKIQRLYASFKKLVKNEQSQLQKINRLPKMYVQILLHIIL